MIQVQHAILHILDFHTGTMVYSDAEMPVNRSVEAFLLKHIERAWSMQEAKPGTFYADSAFAKNLVAYLSDDAGFVAFSKEIAKGLERVFVHADEMESLDILVLDAMIDEARQVVICLCKNHRAFMHQVNQSGTGVQNEIVSHYAILPGPNQKIDEFAFINAKTSALLVCAKKYTMDGNGILVLPEMLLECSLAPSPKEAIKNLSKTAAKVAENYGQDAVMAEAAAKSYVLENMQESDALDLAAAGKEIFRDNPSMQQDFKTAIKDAGFAAPVKMDSEATLKKVCKHKLKTDTGIELTIPTDYFDNTEYIEFNHDTDGTLSITLKHISNIMNRG
ncbi:MAG: nucleoid-associated protein [Mitsuokella sp.]